MTVSILQRVGACVGRWWGGGTGGYMEISVMVRASSSMHQLVRCMFHA